MKYIYGIDLYFCSSSFEIYIDLPCIDLPCKTALFGRGEGEDWPNFNQCMSSYGLPRVQNYTLLSCCVSNGCTQQHHLACPNLFNIASFIRALTLDIPFANASL